MHLGKVVHKNLAETPGEINTEKTITKNKIYKSVISNLRCVKFHVSLCFLLYLFSACWFLLMDIINIFLHKISKMSEFTFLSILLLKSGIKCGKKIKGKGTLAQNQPHFMSGSYME